ncbi:hypothetical protein OPIT5_10135 [Opitutaceae bacterium TAV5]|nr:hypothetical protein OPIT5_10135 [Opitutaceae bacterium TAV5]
MSARTPSGAVSTRRAQLLARLLRYGEDHYDHDPSSGGLLLLPITPYRNKHVEHLPKDALRHPVRESLYYALILLASGDPPNIERAGKILLRIIAAQEQSDPASPRHGQWAYFTEEPVSALRTIDINWADFIGMGLCVAQARFGHVLSRSVADAVRQAIARAARAIRRRNVDLNYTNIAIKGTFVTLAAAELTGDTGLLAYACDRLSRLRALIEGQQVLTEYNSPAYAGVNLVGLHAMESIVRHPAARDDAAALLRRLWLEVADRFHSPTGELAGPHARAYSASLSRLPGWLGPLIGHVTSEKFHYETDDANLFDSIWPLVLEINAPQEAVDALLTETVAPRQVTAATTPWPGEAARVLTTWAEPAFCLGTVAFQDGWEQHHNLIAYWRAAAGATAYLRHRYLRDGRPCCSGYFSAMQRRGEVAAGAFLGAFADDHVMTPVEGVVTSFLGAVLDVDAAGETVRAFLDGEPLRREEGSVPLAVGSVLRVELAAVVFEIELTHHETAPDPAPPARVESLSGDRLRVVLPHYEGGRRFVRWLDFMRAASAYRLRMAAAGKPLSRDLLPDAMFPPRVLPRMELEAWATHWLAHRQAG